MASGVGAADWKKRGARISARQDRQNLADNNCLVAKVACDYANQVQRDVLQEILTHPLFEPAVDRDWYVLAAAWLAGHPRRRLSPKARVRCRCSLDRLKKGEVVKGFTSIPNKPPPPVPEVLRNLPKRPPTRKGV